MSYPTPPNNLVGLTAGNVAATERLNERGRRHERARRGNSIRDRRDGLNIAPTPSDGGQTGEP